MGGRTVANHTSFQSQATKPPSLFFPPTYSVGYQSKPNNKNISLFPGDCFDKNQILFRIKTPLDECNQQSRNPLPLEIDGNSKSTQSRNNNNPVPHITSHSV